MFATFNVKLKNGEMLRGSTLKKRFQSEKKAPAFPGAKIRCYMEQVEVVETTDPRFTIKIYWSNDIFGRDGNVQLLREVRDVPLEIALIEITGCDTWIAKGEPTIDERVGITVYNKKGRLVLTGIGDLTPVEYTPLRKDVKPKQGHFFTFSFREPFSWRKANPMECAHTAGADRTTTPAVYPNYGSPDAGN